MTITTDQTILQADALDLTPEFFAQFDTQITDFPYSSHVHENATSIGSDGRGVQDRDLGFECLSPEFRLMGAIAAASVKRWSLVFSDFEGAHLWRADAEECGAEYIRTVPWVRWSQPQMSGDRPCTGAEAVLVFHAQHNGPRGGVKPIAKRWNGPGSLMAFNRRAMRGKDKHPTEKPIDLLLDMVSWFSDPCESVIDIAGGSGTTAVACKLLGRSCVAVEKKAAHATAAHARLSGPLSDRDLARAREWCETTLTEAAGVPEPSAADGSDVRTYERAQRRVADVERVSGWV